METNDKPLNVLERAVFMMDLDGQNVAMTTVHPLSPLEHVKLLKGVLLSFISSKIVVRLTQQLANYTWTRRSSRRGHAHSGYLA